MGTLVQTESVIISMRKWERVVAENKSLHAFLKGKTPFLIGEHNWFATGDTTYYSVTNKQFQGILAKQVEGYRQSMIKIQSVLSAEIAAAKADAVTAKNEWKNKPLLQRIFKY